MSPGDALASTAAATMALMLTSRALRASRFSLRAKALMALVWVGLILVATAIATSWMA